MLFEHAAFLAKHVVAEVIPDIPMEVETQLARQEFLMSKVIGNLEDDQEDDAIVATGSANILISETDGDWEKEIEEPLEDDADDDEGGGENKEG